MSSDAAGLFPALLKHWRKQRGLSQLDLSLNADVSARHISFLETGKAKPSRGMVLRLGAALDVPMRDQNALLRAAGLEEAYAEPSVQALLDSPLGAAVDRMLEHHEPYPMVVLDRGYDVLRANRGAVWMLQRFALDPTALAGPLNAFHLLFDPRLLRPFVKGWPNLARDMLTRLQREALHNPGDEVLARLADGLRAHPDVPEDLMALDLSRPSEPTFSVRLERDDLQVSFFGTVTVFSAPQNITAEELRIESYFPLDDRTRAAFEATATP